MHKRTITLTIASIIITGVLAASTLYASERHGSHGSMTGDNMMGRGGMMGMMDSMMQIMEHCSQMMQETTDGTRRPNDQWRKTPSASGEKI